MNKYSWLLFPHSLHLIFHYLFLPLISPTCFTLSFFSLYSDPSCLPWPFCYVLSFTFFSSVRFFCFPLPALPPCSPLQACKPNHSTEGGGSGQTLPPHVGPLGQAEDQSCPAKRRRASSPAKVNTTVMASFNCCFPLIAGRVTVMQFNLYFQFHNVFFRVIHGSVTHHSSQFPTGTSPRRNYRLVIALISYLT